MIERIITHPAFTSHYSRYCNSLSNRILISRTTFSHVQRTFLCTDQLRNNTVMQENNKIWDTKFAYDDWVLLETVGCTRINDSAWDRQTQYQRWQIAQRRRKLNNILTTHWCHEPSIHVKNLDYNYASLVIALQDGWSVTGRREKEDELRNFLKLFRYPSHPVRFWQPRKRRKVGRRRATMLVERSSSKPIMGILTTCSRVYATIHTP